MPVVDGTDDTAGAWADAATTNNMVVATKHDIYSCAGMDIDD